MKKSQVKFGNSLVKELSEKLGLTFDQTIEILINRREINSFFDWVNACEYLEEKIWEEPDDSYN